METKMCLIYSTFENEDEAKRAGKTLVEKKLAACINNDMDWALEKAKQYSGV